MRCKFEIEYNDREVVRIRDVGPGRMSVTNDAEAVVTHLLETGQLRVGQRLEYFDSLGCLDEIEFDATGFVGFKVLPTVTHPFGSA